MNLWTKLLRLLLHTLKAKASTQPINSYPQKLSTGGTLVQTRPRFTLLLDMLGTLTAQSLSKAHRGTRRDLSRGVLVAIGIALCLVPRVSSSEPVLIKEYITPKQYALYLLDFNVKEYKCLSTLYGKESAWNPDARNGSHYGIPQGKSEYLATLDAYGQIVWGLDYIGNRYGEPCIALDHWKAKGWH